MRAASKRRVYSSGVFSFNVESMKIILSSDLEKCARPSATLSELGASDRLKLSSRKFALFFALAVVSIFIPVLHFILVPLFFLLSIVFGIKAYSTRYRLKLDGANGCLQCGQSLKNEFLMDESLRLKCERCFADYHVEKEA
jgi:hypothetical protein